MSRHLPRLQIEEAEMLAEIIGQRLTRSAIDILKILGILQDRPEPPEDLNPEEAEVISMAEALLRRNR